jgi:uncharacterized protein (DUF427 family)
MRAIWEGKVLAQSDGTIVVEGNHYFPLESINRQYLRESSTRTTCSWKGEASYYDVVVGNAVNKDAAWHYPSPTDAARHFAHYVAFRNGVEVGAALDDLTKLVYEQASADWRHRDQLTWQMPAVLVVVGGVLVAEAYKLPNEVPFWVRDILLLFAFTLSVSLFVALSQNLLLQRKNRIIIKDINPQTERVGFVRLGSFLLWLLTLAITSFLGWICLNSVCLKSLIQALFA